MAGVTPATLSANSQLATYIAGGALRVAQNRYRNSVIRKVMDVSNQIGSKGTTVNVPVDAAVASYLRTAGSPYTVDSDTGSAVAVTLDKERATPKMLIDPQVAAMVENSRAMDQVMSNIARMFNDAETEFLAAVAAAVTSATYIKGSYGTDISEDNIADLVAALTDQENIPMSDLIGVTGMTPWTDLNKIANFAQALGANAVRTASQDSYGEGTMFHGTRWGRSRGIPRPAAGQHDNLLFFPEAVVFASRPFAKPLSTAAAVQNVVDPISGLAFQIIVGWSEDYGADTIMAKMLYGYGVLNANWIGKLKT